MDLTWEFRIKECQPLLQEIYEDKWFPVIAIPKRCGSHYLRMRLEIYLRQPGLMKGFYGKKPELRMENFTHLWIHPEWKEVYPYDFLEDREVLYFMYRQKVTDTIFSQMYLKSRIPAHQQEVIDDTVRYLDTVSEMSRRLRRLQKNPTSLHISLEEIQKAHIWPMASLLDRLGAVVNETRIRKVDKYCTKERIKKRMGGGVIHYGQDYENLRTNFQKSFKRIINDLIRKHTDRKPLSILGIEA